MAISVLLYETEIYTLLSLPEEQRGRILTAILCDVAGKELPELDAMEKAIFTLVNAQVQRAADKSSKRKQAANARWKNQANEENGDTASELEEDDCMQNCKDVMQNNANAMQNQANEENDDTNPCTNTGTDTITNTGTNTITNTGTNTITNTGTGTDTEATAASQAERRAACPFAKIKELFHTICISYPKIKAIDGTRKNAVSARWKSYPNLETFEELFRIAEGSAFLKGANKKNWLADFDWMMKSTNFAKILEHRYDDKPIGNQSDISPPLNGDSTTPFFYV